VGGSFAEALCAHCDQPHCARDGVYNMLLCARPASNIEGFACAPAGMVEASNQNSLMSHMAGIAITFFAAGLIVTKAGGAKYGARCRHPDIVLYDFWQPGRGGGCCGKHRKIE
jgi:hypothetical protein